MKISRPFIILSILIISAFLLSSCVGGAGVSTGWPGITVDKDRGLAYVAYNQAVHAVNLSNGTEKWRFPAKADAKTTFFAAPSLTTDGDLIIGSYDHRLYKVSADNGQPITSGSWPFQAQNRFIAQPLVTNGSIYAPNADEHVYALNTDGNLLWKFKTDQPVWAKPATDGKLIYQPSMDHRVYALDPSTGKTVWQSDNLGGAMVGTPTIGTDGNLYVGTFSNELVALSSADGKALWHVPTTGWVWAGPAEDNGKLYFGDLKGSLYAVDPTNGNVLWKNETQDGSVNAISDRVLVVGGVVYYTTENGNLNAVDAATGKAKWNKTVGGDKPGKLYGSPQLVDDKTILIAPVGIDPLLVAFDLSGNKQWEFTPTK